MGHASDYAAELPLSKRVFAWVLCASIAVAYALTPARAGADPAVIGQWDPLIGLPVPSVHSIMLHTGKVLIFRGDGHDDVATVPTTYTWDPATGQFNSQDPGANLFCSGHSLLPDGRVLATGGNIEGNSGGPNYVHIFDPLTEQWS